MMRTLVILLALAALLGGADRAAAAEYLVGPEDVLEISVYGNPDLDTLVRVEDDGVIRFPLVGAVAVGGKSVSDISTELAARLADGYLVRPYVTVFVREFRSRTVVVMGQVQRPGLYELSGPLTVIEAISKAGGFTDLAAERRLRILRKADGEEQTLTRVDINAPVLPDDVIVVPESLF